MIFTKVTYESAQFQIFDCSGEIQQIFTLIDCFCWKYIKFQLKKYRGVIVSWYWRVMPNLKKNQFLVSKMTRIWRILIQALKSLRNLHFHWTLSCKVINVWPEKVQSSYLSWHWRSTQNLKKNWCWFRKWHEEFGNLKVSKLVLSWDPFVHSSKCVS